MSDKDLQRVTERVSYIGQRSLSRSFPAQCNHVSPKIRITDQCPSVFDDLIVRPMRMSPQHGASLEKLADLLTGAKFGPCGPVSGNDRLKHYLSLPDLIGRYPVPEYCAQYRLTHVPRRFINTPENKEVHL